MPNQADLERDARATLSDTESTLDLPSSGHEGPTQSSEPAVGEWGGDVESARLFALVRSRMFSRHSTLRIGRYRIVRRLGAGAMGEVHLAIDEELDRPVAIKFVHAHLANERFTQRLRVEARALARLAHTNVVHVYEVGEHEGRVFLAMEYIEGQSLREWAAGESAPGWEQVLAVYLDAGRGLAVAHSAGVVHRDFKPENVLRGADGRVAVADFGLAAVEHQPAALGEGEHETEDEDVEETLDLVSVVRTHASLHPAAVTARSGISHVAVSRTGEVKGTPAYMPPEQFRGHSDTRADQFALCVSLYEALWGQRPFAKRTLAQMLEGDVDWRPLPPPGSRAVPKWIWPIIRRGLAVDPDDRWASVDELLVAFERGLSARRRRARLLGSGVVALAVGLLSGASVAWWSEDTIVDDCANLEHELVDTWDQARRAQLGQVLASAAGSPVAGWLIDSEAPIFAGLDRWRSSWLTSRAELCHARAGGDPVVLDRQGACLERHRRSTQALVDLMLADELDLGTLREAPRAVLGLDDPRACAREARQGGPPEPAESIAARVEQVRRELSVVDAQRLLAHNVTALAKAEQLATRVGELDYAPLSAELAYTRGRALLGAGHSAEGFEVLEQAADLAEGAHHDRVVADSWRQMAMFAATEHPDLQAGRGWLRRADAAAVRVGVDPLGAARLEFVRGNLELLDKQVDAAIKTLEPALLVFEDHQDLLFAAHTATSLGLAALDQSEWQQALRLFGRSLALLERVHGPHHPDVALAAYNFGQISLEAGDAELAQTMLERAVQIWTHADEFELRNLGRAQLVLGQLAFGEGRNEDALQHARAAADAFERSAQVLTGGPPTAATPELAIMQAEAASITAMALYYLVQHDQSITAYNLAIQGYTNAYGADDLYVAYFRVGLAWALLAVGRAEDARLEFESALAVIEAKGGGSEQAVDARFGLIAVDIVTSRLDAARTRLATLEPDGSGPGLAGMELVEFELFRGLLALRRTPSDHAVGALALGHARAQAKTVASGELTLAILLDSVGATPNERRLTGE